ncbi:unnamed protein product [Caenorhabditis angaria]|uniref:Uncharacterized protein n=1 Tax=Caenorhabditis angaria TaxID=860376 RepID=A0A9P1NBN8_9PELO|nr:unnamed protein product [Caenorhabditis angaria]
MSYNLERVHGLNPTNWYQPENELTDLARQLFFKSNPDETTQHFLDKSAELSDNYFWQTIRNLGVMFLSSIYSKTDINGITGFGNMFLFSENQMAKLLDIDRSNWSPVGKKVLDLGAGNGDITRHLEAFYSDIYATELSSRMRKRLSSKGYKVLDALTWDQTDIQFDLITAFNLLDRHYSPQKLLNDLWRVSSRSKCRVIISLVLPVNHYVEFNPNGKSTRPDQFLKVQGKTYADHVHYMITNEFEPAKFRVVKWTRLPYLCEGDMNHSAYYLPDAMFLLEPIIANEETNTTSSTQNTLPTEDINKTEL